VSDPARAPVDAAVVAKVEADLDPRFWAVFRAVTDGARAHGSPWPADLVPVAPGAFRFPLLLPNAASRWLVEIEARRAPLRARGLAEENPNSMHSHGVSFAALGIDDCFAALRRTWIAPLARALLQPFAGNALDAHHGYLVEYGRAFDEDLGFHVDDSEVTLNLCLGEDFDGSELMLLGLRCDTHRNGRILRSEEVAIDHAPGWAVLHAGCLRHRVEPIRRGRRTNAILWCRDSTIARPPTRACGPWCPGATT